LRPRTRRLARPLRRLLLVFFFPLHTPIQTQTTTPCSCLLPPLTHILQDAFFRFPAPQASSFSDFWQTLPCLFFLFPMSSGFESPSCNHLRQKLDGSAFFYPLGAIPAQCFNMACGAIHNQVLFFLAPVLTLFSTADVTSPFPFPAVFFVFTESQTPRFPF